VSIGQHFAKMYDITIEDPAPHKEGETKPRLLVWQNSWGLSTRSIGVMMLVHGDDKGAVVPPRVAETQAVIIPVGVTAKTTEEEKTKLSATVDEIASTLQKAGVRAEKDTRDHYSPGWRFADAEIKGIPIRIEFGPKDMANGTVMTVRRDNGEKASIKVDDLATGVPELLEKMQAEMLARARKEYDEHRVVVTKWEELVPILNKKNVVLIPHCESGDCADSVKDETSGVGEDEKAPSMGAKCKFCY
jgi:prolyl-tRNA synthetase